jgi:glycosyltransferase involved in cell wall biosynthesis
MKSITILVPALNEESNLLPTVEKILNVVPSYFDKYEIIIYDDGSTDGTTRIGNELSLREGIEFIRHDESMNLGYIYQDGIRRAKNQKLIMIHGQNDIYEESLHKIFAQAKSPIVIPFQMNTFDRPLGRAVISRLFVHINNLIFNLKLKYYNHYVLCDTDLLRKVDITSFSYAFQAEVLIKLIKAKVPFVEVGIRDDFSNKKESKAFRLKNILGVAKFYGSVLSYLYLSKPRVIDEK